MNIFSVWRKSDLVRLNGLSMEKLSSVSCLILLVCILIFCPNYAAATQLDAGSWSTYPKLANPDYPHANGVDLPLYFESVGPGRQTNNSYIAHAAGYDLRISSHRVDIQWDDNAASVNVGILFHGATQHCRGLGQDQFPGKVSRLIGKDQINDSQDMSMYTKVCYKEIYPGIDVEFYGVNGELEFDFIVAPKANFHNIRLLYEGFDNLLITEDGSLLATTAVGELRQHKPVVYQESNRRKTIPAEYQISENGSVGLQIGQYDRSLPLIIDPILSYSTFLGGKSEDQANDIAVDKLGCIYITGRTKSTKLYEEVDGAYKSYIGKKSFQGDAYVAKLAPDGKSLMYFTYLGGKGDDSAFGIAVDDAGAVYLTGLTASVDFPTTPNAFQADMKGSKDEFTSVYPYEAFVAKLAPSGAELVYATYLGGSLEDQGIDIVVDSLGSAYVTGATSSIDFPTKLPLSAFSGAKDAFVSKLDPSGSALVFSTYIGGSAFDSAEGIDLTPDGQVVLGGLTDSWDFPTKNAWQAQNFGAFDAFLCMLSPDGANLLYATYIGGTADDYIFRLDVDPLGKIHIAGQTLSVDFPVINAIQPTYGGGGSDAFVAQTSPAASDFEYITFWGGRRYDAAWDIMANQNGETYVVGATTSSDFPTLGTIHKKIGDSDDAFVTKFSQDGLSAQFSTFWGGSGIDVAYGCDLAPSGNVTITGPTSAKSKFHTTLDSLQSKYGGSLSDAFITQFSLQAPAIEVDVTGDRISISWPLSDCAAKLQASSDLSQPDGWQSVNKAVEEKNGYRKINLKIAEVSQFYRLAWDQ
jgi:hypothetical protein